MIHNRTTLIILLPLLMSIICKSDENIKNNSSIDRKDAIVNKIEHTTLKILPNPTIGLTSTVTASTFKTSSIVSEIEDGLETVLPEIEDSGIIESEPNMRETLGLQRALDWLREKRSSDFGWGNDTHMVILSKEVLIFNKNLMSFC